LRLLLVEDNPDDAELVLNELIMAGYDLDWQRVDDEASFLKLLNPRIDVILSDYSLPQFSAIRALALLRESRLTVPCIVVTGTVGEEAAVACMRQGASDYLLKDRLSRLGTAVAQAIEGRRLRESHAQFAAIAECSDDAIIAIASDGTIATWNRGSEVLYGYDADEARGQPVTLLVAPDRVPELRHVVNQVSNGLRVQHREMTSLTKDGRTLEVSVSIFPVLNAEGQPVSAAAIVRDMTAEHERQRQAAQSERLRALGQLAGGVAHDLNQSLALILGYSDLVKSALRGPGPNLTDVADMVSIIGQAAADGGETVKRLLTFARSHPDRENATVDVTALLHDVALLTAPRWRDASEAEGRSIHLDVAAEPGLTMLGSDSHLKEMLTNLIFNAVDALPTGGSIRLSATARGDQIVMTVADSGVGMPPDVQERLFEPFFTTKGERGTGLGLPFVIGVVKGHGGAIEVRSSPGCGTTFVMTFARAGRTSTKIDTPPASALEASAFHILAVDDEPDIARMFVHMLREHHVITATSGDEAIRILTAARQEGRAFDVMMTDIGLGSGMTGWDLADHAHQIQPGLPVVLVSGWGASIEERDARKRGIHGVIGKPFRNAQIREMLATVVPQDRGGVAPSKGALIGAPGNGSQVTGQSVGDRFRDTQ
jgi:PAS domain S-box-containing protein